MVKKVEEGVVQARYDRQAVLSLLRVAYGDGYFFKLGKDELDALSLDGTRGMLRAYTGQLNATLLSRRRLLERLFDLTGRYEFALRKIALLEGRKGWRPRYSNLHRVRDVRDTEALLLKELLKEVRRG